MEDHYKYNLDDGYEIPSMVMDTGETLGATVPIDTGNMIATGKNHKKHSNV